MQSITYTLEARDFQEYHRYSLLHVPAIQKIYLPLVVLIPLVAIAATGYLQYRDIGMLTNTFYVAAGLAVPLGVLIVAGALYLNPFNTTYLVYTKQFGKGALSCTLALAEDGLLHRLSSDVETRWPFSGFSHVQQSQNLYLLFLKETPNRALVIPRRAFATPEAARDFMAAVTNRLSPVTPSSG